MGVDKFETLIRVNSELTLKNRHEDSRLMHLVSGNGYRIQSFELLPIDEFDSYGCLRLKSTPKQF